jgi:two-component system, NarL family, vancomycin resistance associated response regulator VraR
MPGLLIVDDDPTIRALIRTFLETKSRFKVCGEAGDGHTAIAMVRELSPDIVLLDLVMPDLNGVQVSSVLKKLSPNIKIILFTFFTDIPGKALAAAAGVDAILSKTDGLKGIEETLQKVSSKAIHAEPSAANADAAPEGFPPPDEVA